MIELLTAILSVVVILLAATILGIDYYYKWSQDMCDRLIKDKFELIAKYETLKHNYMQLEKAIPEINSKLFAEGYAACEEDRASEEISSLRSNYNKHD